MFEIRPFDPSIDCSTLEPGDNIWHRAHEEGSTRYHVDTDDAFDIVLVDNDSYEPAELYPSYVKPPYMASYKTYDEYDRRSLYLDLFLGFSDIWFESVNEYTVALAKVCLTFTKLEVYFKDKRAKLFIEGNPRLHVVDSFPEEAGTPAHMAVTDKFDMGLRNGFCSLSPTNAFHNVFFLQWLLDGRDLDQFRFATMHFDDHGGLGSNLANFRKYEKIFGRFGIKFILNEDRFGKYPITMLRKYFSFDFSSEEAVPENTLVIPNQFIFTRTKPGLTTKVTLDTSILAPEFKKNIDFYYDSLFGGRKMLGVLIRGTDYLTAGLKGIRKPAAVDDMKDMISQWVKEYGYEKIFLATEDMEILTKMRDIFGDKIAAVAQERLTTADLKPGQIISELEKELYEGKEYFDRMEDTTANYFYALYILSRCDGFICSGQCNGYDIVTGLNEGRFTRTYVFEVGRQAK